MVDAGPVRPRHPHAPRLADGGDSAGHRDGRQVADPFEALEVGHEQLPAPQRPVEAVAETVEGQAEHRSRAAVLGEARRHVGVVVLHRDGRRSRSIASFVERYSGCRSWATTSGVTP